MPHSVFGATHLLHPMQNYRALKLGLLQAERGNSRPSTAETSFQSSVLIWRRLRSSYSILHFFFHPSIYFPLSNNRSVSLILFWLFLPSTRPYSMWIAYYFLNIWNIASLISLYRLLAVYSFTPKALLEVTDIVLKQSMLVKETTFCILLRLISSVQIVLPSNL